MSDFQLILLSVGAIIIAVVILFNWWQERRIRHEMVRRFDGPVDDVLMAGKFNLNPKPVINPGGDSPSVSRLDRKVEPTISFDDIEPAEIFPDETEQVGQAWAEGETQQEDSPSPFDEPDSMPVQAMAPMPGSAPEQVSIVDPSSPAQSSSPPVAGGDMPVSVDEKIDLVAMMVPAQTCSGEKLRETLLSLQLFGKSCQWLGLNADNVWCHLEKHQEPVLYSRVVGALQLADRSGAVPRDILNNFQLRTKDAADSLAATLEWSGQSVPHHYAQELDQFCVEVDVMVGMHLVAAPFAGTKLRGLAEAGGMTLHDDGMFHYVNDLGETLFAMTGQDNQPFSLDMLRTALIHTVTLQLDVPRVKNFPEVFNKMVLLARRMEQGLNAKLVDDNQRVLGDADIEIIRQRLKVIYGAMAARAIQPGSPTALRLFS